MENTETLHQEESPPVSAQQIIEQQPAPGTGRSEPSNTDILRILTNTQIQEQNDLNREEEGLFGEVEGERVDDAAQQEKQQPEQPDVPSELPPQSQDNIEVRQQSKQTITEGNESRKSMKDQAPSDLPNQSEADIPPANPSQREERSHRASKISQQSQSRSMSEVNQSHHDQIRNNVQKESAEVDGDEGQPRGQNFDEIESTIIKKNESGEVIKKVIQIVKIVRNSRAKPFLGGFRHATTDIIYHNGFSQTDQNRTEHKLQFTREVQTYQYSTKSSKVSREFGTQMAKEGLFVDQRNDKIIYPGVYFTSEMWLERRIEAALYIQRLTRGMFARRQTNKLKGEKLAKQLDKLSKEEEVRKKEEIKHKKEIERRRNPRTKEDFEILHQELENWRMAEVEKIKGNKTLTSEQRRKALKETLDKETDLLQTIDRLKIIAAKQNKEQKVQKFLKSMSDPKRWVRKYDGRVTEVHTPFTVRAKELMDLYKGLKMKNVSTDERLDILLATKWTVKEWDCNLTREIVQLIDREGSILDRGRPESSLQGLRQRLSNLFLQFIEYPLFNPQAARFQKIPYEIAEVGQQFH